MTTQSPSPTPHGVSSSLPFFFPGIGLEGAKFLAASGDWHVIMAVRSFAKAEAGAKDLGMDPSTYTVMNLDLASLNSVRNFVAEIKAAKVKVDALVCNAAVWHPKVCSCRGEQSSGFGCVFLLSGVVTLVPVS